MGYQYNYNESVTVDTFKESAVTRLPLTGVNFLEKKSFAADRVAYAFQRVLGGEYLKRTNRFNNVCDMKSTNRFTDISRRKREVKVFCS